MLPEDLLAFSEEAVASFTSQPLRKEIFLRTACSSNIQGLFIVSQKIHMPYLFRESKRKLTYQSQYL